MNDFRIPLPDGASLTATAYPSAPPSIPGALILAHGAGAGQGSPFMVETATGLAALGIDTVTFDFPYVEQGRRLPDRPAVLHDSYQAVIRAVRTELASAAHTLFIGGKSMGGRIATEVVAEDPSLRIAGIVPAGVSAPPAGPSIPAKRPASTGCPPADALCSGKPGCLRDRCRARTRAGGLDAESHAPCRGRR